MIEYSKFNEEQLEYLAEIEHCYTEDEVKIIANPSYTVRQMELMQHAIDNNYDTNLMINKNVTEMRYTLEGFNNHVDMEPYMHKNYTGLQLRVILNCLKLDVNPGLFICRAINRGSFFMIDKEIKEFKINQCLDIIKNSNYNVIAILNSFNEFSLEQLIEIADGVKYNIDITKYANKNVSPSKMKIVKEYLIKGIDISKYITECNYSCASLKNFGSHIEKEYNNLLRWKEYIAPVPSKPNLNEIPKDLADMLLEKQLECVNYNYMEDGIIHYGDKLQNLNYKELKRDIISEYIINYYDRKFIDNNLNYSVVGCDVCVDRGIYVLHVECITCGTTFDVDLRKDTTSDFIPECPTCSARNNYIETISNALKGTTLVVTDIEFDKNNEPKNINLKCSKCGQVIVYDELPKVINPYNNKIEYIFTQSCPSCSKPNQN